MARACSGLGSDVTGRQGNRTPTPRRRDRDFLRAVLLEMHTTVVLVVPILFLPACDLATGASFCIIMFAIFAILQIMSRDEHPRARMERVCGKQSLIAACGIIAMGIAVFIASFIWEPVGRYRQFGVALVLCYLSITGFGYLSSRSAGRRWAGPRVGDHAGPAPSAWPADRTSGLYARRHDIQRCVCCGYSLVGHPTNCTCPECAEVYDGRTFVLYGRSREFVDVVRWVVVPLVALGGISTLFRRAEYIAGCALAAVILYMILGLPPLRWVREATDRWFLMTGPDGITLRNKLRTAPVRRLPWDQFRRAVAEHGNAPMKALARFLRHYAVLFRPKDLAMFAEYAGSESEARCSDRA